MALGERSNRRGKAGEKRPRRLSLWVSRRPVSLVGSWFTVGGFWALGFARNPSLMAVKKMGTPLRVETVTIYLTE
jgi:hypothetical protein